MEGEPQPADDEEDKIVLRGQLGGELERVAGQNERPEEEQ